MNRALLIAALALFVAGCNQNRYPPDEGGAGGPSRPTEYTSGSRTGAHSGFSRTGSDGQAENNYLRGTVNTSEDNHRVGTTSSSIPGYGPPARQPATEPQQPQQQQQPQQRGAQPHGTPQQRPGASQSQSPTPAQLSQPQQQ